MCISMRKRESIYDMQWLKGIGVTGFAKEEFFGAFLLSRLVEVDLTTWIYILQWLAIPDLCYIYVHQMVLIAMFPIKYIHAFTSSSSWPQNPVHNSSTTAWHTVQYNNQCHLPNTPDRNSSSNSPLPSLTLLGQPNLPISPVSMTD